MKGLTRSRVHSATQQDGVAGADSPSSARGQRVTSTMPPTSPYDHTAPQVTPRFYPRPPPRSHFYAQTTSYAHRTPDSSAAVWQHGPQRLSRGYRPRDGIYYDRVRDVRFPPFNQIPPNTRSYFQAYAGGRLPHMLAQQPSLPRISIPRNQINGREIVSTRPSGLLSICDGTENDSPKPKPKPKTESRSSDWFAGLARKKRRRPSEIFNKNFGFHAASLRAPSDHTPQISPRTSISNDNVLSPSRMEESVKRPRVDSQGADMALGFPFGKPTTTQSTRGRDLGSSAMLPRGSIALATPSASRHGPMCSGEVHPGTPVDWNAPRTCPVRNDAHVAPELRRKSFPGVSALAQRKRSKVMAMLGRVQGVDATAKPYGPLQSDTMPTARRQCCTSERKQSSSSERKLSCTTERNDYAHATMAPSNPIPSRAPSVEPVHEPEVPSVHALKRATSDPSTDAFLRHVRASLERRRSRDTREKGRAVMDYPVFADEYEKGFLDDAPL